MFCKTASPKPHIVIMKMPGRLNPQTLEFDCIDQAKRFVKENVADPKFTVIAHYSLIAVYKDVKA